MCVFFKTLFLRIIRFKRYEFKHFIELIKSRSILNELGCENLETEKHKHPFPRKHKFSIQQKKQCVIWFC